jgi:hypothetical protein
MIRMLPWFGGEQRNLLGGVHHRRVVDHDEKERHGQQIRRGQVQRRPAAGLLLTDGNPTDSVHGALRSARGAPLWSTRRDAVE